MLRRLWPILELSFMAKLSNLDFNLISLYVTVSFTSCRKHGNVDLAKQVAKRIMELDKNGSCSYVLMSNLYVASHRFEEAMDERLLMKEKKIEKEQGVV
ncbi:hypothetical protein Dsin_030627 [Dipteronia sinensis]|uniref:Pentatricopeptide repeat-containing protein n=1 Tax=Dipteronia sinensis TaxID=43782 RepID=A0AAD9ZJW3_9ROSI|nr:hypothetical protein Dsin_030627 [Dipteronia sinensis]